MRKIKGNLYKKLISQTKGKPQRIPLETLSSVCLEHKAIPVRSVMNTALIVSYHHCNNLWYSLVPHTLYV